MSFCGSGTSENMLVAQATRALVEGGSANDLPAKVLKKKELLFRVVDAALAEVRGQVTEAVAKIRVPLDASITELSSEKARLTGLVKESRTTQRQLLTERDGARSELETATALIETLSKENAELRRVFATAVAERDAVIAERDAALAEAKKAKSDLMAMANTMEVTARLRADSYDRGTPMSLGSAPSSRRNTGDSPTVFAVNDLLSPTVRDTDSRDPAPVADSPSATATASTAARRTPPPVPKVRGSRPPLSPATTVRDTDARLKAQLAQEAAAARKGRVEPSAPPSGS